MTSRRKLIQRLGHKPTRGQAMVEFVMIIVLFTTLMIYALELTFVQNAQSMVNLAGYSVARKWAVTQDQAKANAVAHQYLDVVSQVGGIDNRDLIDVWISNAPSYGGDFKVRVSMEYPLLQGVAKLFPGAQVGNPILTETTYDGTAPPTRQDLRLGANQVMNIINRKQLGQQYYKWTWYVKTWKSWGIFGTSDHHTHGPFHATLPYGQTPDWYNTSSGGFLGLGKNHRATADVKKVGLGPAWFQYQVQIITQGGTNPLANTVQLVNWTPMSAD